VRARCRAGCRQRHHIARCGAVSHCEPPALGAGNPFRNCRTPPQVIYAVKPQRGARHAEQNRSTGFAAARDSQAGFSLRKHTREDGFDFSRRNPKQLCNRRMCSGTDRDGGGTQGISQTDTSDEETGAGCDRSARKRAGHPARAIDHAVLQNRRRLRMNQMGCGRS
jgi:hypothetical protein